MDTSTYVSLYYQLGVLPISDFIGTLKEVITYRFEPGFVILNKILYSLALTPRWLIVIAATTIILSLGYYLISFSKNPVLSVLIFLTMGIFAFSMNGIRQSIALSFIVLAYCSLVKKRKINFFLFVLFAFLFHRTAIIFLLAYPLSKINFNLRSFLLLIGGTAVIFAGFSGVMNKILSIFTTYQYYSSAINTSEMNVATIIKTVIIASILALCLACKKIGDPKRFKALFPDNRWSLMMLLLVCSMCVYLISMKFYQISRISGYFDFIYVILLPNSICLIKSGVVRSIICISVGIVFVAYFIVIQILRPEWNGIVPYQFG